MLDAERTPVIVGFGEVSDRGEDPDQALEPVALMAEALRRADADASGGLLARVDSLDLVNQISWPYDRPADLVCERLGIDPKRRQYGLVGGETPLKFIQEAAERIRWGHTAVAAICGGEAHRTVAAAARDGHRLPWTPPAADPAPSVRGQDRAAPLARALGVHLPVTVYPLFETAQAARWGQTLSAASAESARMWSAMARVAAGNPLAAIRDPLPPAAIATPSPTNRMIAEPYTKRMVANISVNLGAAVILCSLAVAQRLGIPRSRLVYPVAGARAEEPADYLVRPDLGHNSAREIILEHALYGWSNGFDHVELYSCFPCVPKAARRVLRRDEGAEATLAGGLTFFGAPLNNYMLHATAAALRRLRDRGGTALLYGQGGFATKHRTLILASEPGPQAKALNTDLQACADARRGADRRFDPAGRGVMQLESFTIIHDRAGGRHGVVVALDEGGARTLAMVAPEDAATLAALTDDDNRAVGRHGRVRSSGPADTPYWEFDHV